MQGSISYFIIEVCFVRLYCYKGCSIVVKDRNEISSCVSTLLDSLLSESEVVFMSFILFLILALMASVTLNVALLTVCYIQCVNKIIDKE